MFLKVIETVNLEPMGLLAMGILDEVLNRIESGSYLENNKKHIILLQHNPLVAYQHL